MNKKLINLLTVVFAIVFNSNLIAKAVSEDIPSRVCTVQSDPNCPCNPCETICAVAGSFTVVGGAITTQCGCNFIVSALPGSALGAYRVTFLSPFCNDISVVAINTATANSTVFLVSHDKTSFTIGGVQDNDTVYFIAVPVCL